MATEFIAYREAEGRAILWPLIAAHYKVWSVGRHSSSTGAKPVDDAADAFKGQSWFPCEALVRIVCKELYRLSQRMFDKAELNDLGKDDQMIWASLVLNLFTEILAVSVRIEDAARQSLLDLREQASIDRRHLETEEDDFFDQRLIETPFGRGRVTRVRKDSYHNSADGDTTEVAVNVVGLDFGATLYQPEQASRAQTSNTNGVVPVIPSEVNSTFIDG